MKIDDYWIEPQRNNYKSEEPSTWFIKCAVKDAEIWAVGKGKEWLADFDEEWQAIEFINQETGRD